MPIPRDFVPWILIALGVLILLYFSVRRLEYFGPTGTKALTAERLLVKRQLLIINRPRRRAELILGTFWRDQCESSTLKTDMP